MIMTDVSELERLANSLFPEYNETEPARPEPSVPVQYQRPTSPEAYEAPAPIPSGTLTDAPVAVPSAVPASVPGSSVSVAPAFPSGGGYSPRVLSETQASEEPAVRESAAAAAPVSRDPVIGSKTLSEIRADFPILKERINGHPLVWLDNGATTQRPQSVIDRLSYYYTHENSNVHRGAHELAARSTDAYENARQIVADFIGAPRKEDIVFVRGTTEAINLVARAFVRPILNPGDEIVLTYLEHHANIVPWQLIAEETGAVLKVAPVDESGQIILSEYRKLFTSKTKFASATQVSNALGTVTPVAEMIACAHAHGVPILIDGAQSVAHMPVNVSALDADFFVFSGHKIYAPTGIGVVYGKSHLLEQARPYQGGGNMIKDVTFERTIYNPAPNKFEAGTGSIADAVGLGAALQYLSTIGMSAVAAWEHELLQYAMTEMRKIPGLHLVGTAADKASVLSFVLDGVDNESVGQHLNSLGIAVRTGHHCAQPILRRFGLEGTVRPTLALYNSYDDVDALVAGIRSIA
ncbi:MAG: SufS family cysteine desulfurase [Lachnospiraceae bacterium]|nr:SufS family cysteine desulfurase [Lachnospiraceae bacterium]